MIVGRDAIRGQVLGLTVKNGRIAAVEYFEEHTGEDLPWLAPGLVDLQVNGWGGYDFNRADIDEKTVCAIAAGLRLQGVRAFLPTLITASREAICHALSVIASARGRHEWLAEMTPVSMSKAPSFHPMMVREAHIRWSMSAPRHAKSSMSGRMPPADWCGWSRSAPKLRVSRPSSITSGNPAASFPLGTPRQRTPTSPWRHRPGQDSAPISVMACRKHCPVIRT